MDEVWTRVSRRLWFALLVRYIGANVVLAPSVVAVALLVSAPFPNAIALTPAFVVPLGVVVNLAASLWATRQALLKRYPEGRFEFVRSASAA